MNPSTAPKFATMVTKAAQPMANNFARRVLLGATESMAMPQPVNVQKKLASAARPPLRWAAGATESHAAPVRM
mgnify:CR=1 FL=1